MKTLTFFAAGPYDLLGREEERYVSGIVRSSAVALAARLGIKKNTEEANVLADETCLLSDGSYNNSCTADIILDAIRVSKMQNLPLMKLNPVNSRMLAAKRLRLLQKEFYGKIHGMVEIQHLIYVCDPMTASFMTIIRRYQDPKFELPFSHAIGIFAKGLPVGAYHWNLEKPEFGILQ